MTFDDFLGAASETGLNILSDVANQNLKSEPKQQQAIKQAVNSPGGPNWLLIVGAALVALVVGFLLFKK